MIKKNYSSVIIMNLFAALTFILALAACTAEDNPDPTGSEYLEITVQGNETRQTIHNFGASDAWSTQFVGKNWPLEKREQIAEWLFSMETDTEGSPKGIGLTAWRFNIGGGSAWQGAGSGINDEWRRAESFMTSEDTYDWTAHQGQRWFMNAAQQHGVETMIGFVNSPPVYLTKNGRAYSSDPDNYNLPEENYSAFAEYLAQVVMQLEENDQIRLDYLSPFNEPQWDWTNSGQEGTPAQNSEIAAVTRIINQKLQEYNLQTLLEIPEAATLVYLYDQHDRPGRGNQIHAFFNPQSPHYIGNLSHMAPKVAGHSYFTTFPVNDMSTVRKSLKNIIDNHSTPLEFWMTEYCVLENNSEINGNGRDLGMPTALYAARVVFSDLVIGGANAWQWWLAVSPYDYKDGLVYTDYNKMDGAIYDSKWLWALGNFSRFVRPGMQRVAVARNDGRTDEATLDNVMATAFVSPDGTNATAVLINYTQNTIPVKIILKDLPASENMNIYLTDARAGHNLKFVETYTSGQIFDLPPRSVVTFSNHL